MGLLKYKDSINGEWHTFSITEIENIMPAGICSLIITFKDGNRLSADKIEKL